MNKIVGVTKPMYELCRVLEDKEDKLNFSVFNSFAEILESRHFCPGWYFDKVYFEIQYDDNDCIKVIDFGINECKEIGDILTDKQVIELTEKINKL